MRWYTLSKGARGPRTRARPMSITFYIAVEGRGQEPDWKSPLHNCNYDDPACPDCITHEMNLSNTNARNFVEWLEMAEDGPGFGEIKAGELVARCKRRLWNEPRNDDPELTVKQVAEELGINTSDRRIILTGRISGYLRDKTKIMLAIAELAGDKYICWS